MLRKIFLSLFFSIISISIQAQLSESGYYRLKNVNGNYLKICNNKFDYPTIFVAAGGGSHMVNLRAFGFITVADNKGVDAALACMRKYLKTDLKLVSDADCLDPSTVLFLKEGTARIYKGKYDIIGQSTSLLDLTTGERTSSGNKMGIDYTLTCTFSDIYTTFTAKNGTSGLNTLYSASVELKGHGAITGGINQENDISIGNEYFYALDENTFSSKNTESFEWYLEPISQINVNPTVPYDGKFYTTYFAAFPYQLGGNIENAYVIENINSDGTVDKVSIASKDNQEFVPAGTAVILECSSQTGNYIVLSNSNEPRKDSESGYSGINILKGTYFCNTDGLIGYPVYSGSVGSQGTTTENAKSFNANNYTSFNASTMRVFGKNSKGQVGFFKSSNDKMKANKAWLDISSVNAVKAEYTMEFDDMPTSIDNVTDNQLKNNMSEIYDLQGRRLRSLENAQQGIYIVNGKKIYIK